jgi:hypothetical protein
MNTHFTAWLVNDTSALETAACDITILQDEINGYRTDDEGNETTPEWTSTDTQMFHAVTTVDAKEGDINDAITEATDLMSKAGWTTVGDWEAVDIAYVITVERN